MIPPLPVILMWPLVVAILFASLRPAQAIVWSILAGYLFLPEKVRFNLPLIPTLDKDTVPLMAALVAAIIVVSVNRRQGIDGPILEGWLPRSRLAHILLLCIPVMAVGTVLTNGDTLVYGRTALPGLSLYEVGSLGLYLAVTVIPFILARKFLGHPDTQKVLLRALVIGGLIYSLLALYEVRMSPMLHTKIYGFFQHVWNQHERGSGYRPIVFLQHGLWVSLFFSTATLSALALFRTEENWRKRASYLGAAGWLFLVLILTKSLGALAVTVLLGPIILFLPGRLQILAAAAVAAMVITYPALRGADLIPTDRIVEVAGKIDPRRAGSFGYRVINEDLLLDKASERPVFGWGRFGRSRVYSESGTDISVTDGYWIIRISQSGWFGYIVEFGLFCGAILLLAFKSRRSGFDAVTAALALVLAGNLLDLIPNAGQTPITWMLAGALFGRIEYGRLDVADASGAVTETDRQGVPRGAAVGYSRFGPGSAAPVRERDAGAAQGYSRYSRSSPVSDFRSTTTRKT